MELRLAWVAIPVSRWSHHSQLDRPSTSVICFCMAVFPFMAGMLSSGFGHQKGGHRSLPIFTLLFISHDEGRVTICSSVKSPMSSSVIECLASSCGLPSDNRSKACVYVNGTI